MKAHIIYDEVSREAHLFTGWGLSVMLGGYLFDTGDKGHSLLENMKRLQFSVYDIDSVIISHDHWDHWGGLWDLLGVRPGLQVYGGEGFSAGFKQKVAESGGIFVPVGRAPVRLNEQVILTGELEGVHKGNKLTEISAAIRTEHGMSVCTGCAHPGIVAIAEQTAALFPGEKLNIFFGGFHLHQKTENEIDAVFSKLHALGFSSILPGHCSGTYAKQKGTTSLFAGMVIDL
jgi:7,8-dihydropterin-6-yl-methyl-4-(beta-D-ribofuranosyl)aminobenzene 5'-phosphate synthase